MDWSAVPADQRMRHVFPIPAIRLADRSRHCSADCAEADRRARRIERHPHPKGVRQLRAFIELLDRRDPSSVANGLDPESVAVRRARYSPPKALA